MSKVIVDTSVWSIALRSRVPSRESGELLNLVDQFRVEMLGIVRQELLSGIRSESQFNKLKDYLRAFPDIVITTEIYELGASFFNQCRSKGVQGSHIDFLICAAASHYDSMIFTTDLDFENYAKHLPIKLYK